MKKAIKDIKVDNGDLVCSASGFRAGQSCTYFVDVDLSAKDPYLISTGIKAIDSNGKAQNFDSSTYAEIQDGAYILMSRPGIINIGDNAASGETNFTLLDLLHNPKLI